MAWFLNQYLCDTCKRQWEDVRQLVTTIVLIAAHGT